MLDIYIYIINNEIYIYFINQSMQNTELVHIVYIYIHLFNKFNKNGIFLILEIKVIKTRKI